MITVRELDRMDVPGGFMFGKIDCGGGLPSIPRGVTGIHPFEFTKPTTNPLPKESY